MRRGREDDDFVTPFIEMYLEVLYSEDVDFLSKNFEGDTFLHVLFKNNKSLLTVGKTMGKTWVRPNNVKHYFDEGYYFQELIKTCQYFSTLIKAATKQLGTNQKLKLFEIKNRSGDTILS